MVKSSHFSSLLFLFLALMEVFPKFCHNCEVKWKFFSYDDFYLVKASILIDSNFVIFCKKMMLDFIHLFVSIETILGNFLQIPFMKIVKDTEKPKDCIISLIPDTQKLTWERKFSSFCFLVRQANCPLPLQDVALEFFLSPLHRHLPAALEFLCCPLTQPSP